MERPKTDDKFKFEVCGFQVCGVGVLGSGLRVRECGLTVPALVSCWAFWISGVRMIRVSDVGCGVYHKEA